MSTLYNKILNEVYLIQDFDSWDDTEQTFKKDIAESIGPIFKYRIDDWTMKSLGTESKISAPVPRSIQIFELSPGGMHDWDNFYQFNKNVYINGKHASILKQGKTEEFYDIGEYDVLIKDLNTITDTTYMFFKTDISYCPAFDFRESISTLHMFFNCRYLKKVGKFDLSNIREAYSMFSGCVSLEEVPLMDLSGCWNISNMFSCCYSLSEETKEAWKETAIKRKLYIPGIKETVNLK